MKPGLSMRDLRILGIADAAYGATAGLVIVIGICRVIWGIKGADFYLSNPWFWAKMASFALIGILSIAPTIAILKWRKAARANTSFLPPDVEVARLRLLVKTEVALLALVVVFAAAMARYGAF